MNQREILSKNLKRLIKSKGIDQRILADYLGISEMSVSYWVNGAKYPRMSNIQKMADYFGVKKSDLIEDKESDQLFTSTDYKYYPTSISAGLPIVAESVTEYDVEKINIPDNLMGKWAGNNDIFVTKINGDSMNKIIPDQSLIAVKSIEQHELKDGDIVVYSDNHEYAVKRFYRDGEKLVFKPESNDTSFYDYITDISNDSLVIHGKVVLYIVELD